MPWIFGSFLVTACALTSCHVVISKQGSTIRSLRYNRCVTGRRPRDENNAVTFRQSAENRVEPGTRSRSEVSRLARGCKRWHPLAPGRRYGKKKSSEYISLHPSFTHHRNINPFENKVWEIHIFYKEVCSFVRSFIEVCKLCLIIFPLVFVLRLFNTIPLIILFWLY